MADAFRTIARGSSPGTNDQKNDLSGDLRDGGFLDGNSNPQKSHASLHDLHDIYPLVNIWLIYG